MGKLFRNQKSRSTKRDTAKDCRRSSAKYRASDNRLFTFSSLFSRPKPILINCVLKPEYIKKFQINCGQRSDAANKSKAIYFRERTFLFKIVSLLCLIRSQGKILLASLVYLETIIGPRIMFYTCDVDA